MGSGTVTGLILIYLGGSLGVNTYLIKGFFDTVPVEIDESAKIDGASHVRIFFGLVLRLSAPVMVVVFFVTFTFVFNELAIAQTLLPNTTDTTLGGRHADVCLRQPAGVGQVRRGSAAGRGAHDHGVRVHPEVPRHRAHIGRGEGLRAHGFAASDAAPKAGFSR